MIAAHPETRQAGATMTFTLYPDTRLAIRACVEAGGDVDTTAAIVGGVVAGYAGVGTPNGVPAYWLAAREPLPGWLG
nr:ADP-ribosylglycohydrolase family protein [Micromonospora radicis]